MKNHQLLLLIALMSPLILISKSILLEGEIQWNENFISKTDELTARKYISFKNAKYDDKRDYLGFYSEQLRLNQEKIVSINIIDVQYEEVDGTKIKGISGVDFISDNIGLKFINATSRKVNYGEIIFTPIIYNSSQAKYQRVISYKIQVNTQKYYSNSVNNKAFTTSSVLSSGDWYKIAVLKDGVFKLSYSFLKGLGMDIDNLNPNDFKLYGNGGKMLPALNSDYREDDIKQNAVHVEGAIDGSFDNTDYVLFYGQSPHTWKYNSLTSNFEHELNQYSDTTYYFITFSNTGESAKRIITQPSQTSPNQSVNSFNAYAYYEKDLVNLIKSGNKWFGEVFDIKTAYDFVFNFPNIDVSTPITINFSGAGRSSASSAFTATVGANSLNVPISSVTTSCYTCSLYNNRLIMIKPKMHPVMSLSALSFFYYIQKIICISISQPVYLLNNDTAVLRDILACANKLVNRLPKSPSRSNSESSDATALISIGAE